MIRMKLLAVYNRLYSYLILYTTCVNWTVCHVHESKTVVYDVPGNDGDDNEIPLLYWRSFSEI